MRAMKRPTRARFALYAAAVLAVTALVLASGCATGSTVATGNVDNPTAKKLIEQGVRLIDVRTASEFEAGHIPNAENAPVDELLARSADWDRTRPLIVYCATGARSADAAAYLASQGFRKVYDLEKGVVSWTGELVRGPSATPAPTGAVKTDGKRLFIEFSTST